MSINNIPQLCETMSAEFSAEMLELSEKIAKNVHEVWVESRIKEGWTYGNERNDAVKKHPCLVPYEELPESEKASDRRTALATLTLINRMGYIGGSRLTNVQEWQDNVVDILVECINGKEHSIVPVVGMAAFNIKGNLQESLQEYIVREISMRYISDEMKKTVSDNCKIGDVKAMTHLCSALKKYGNDEYRKGGFNDESMDIYQCIYNVIKDVKSEIDINPQIKDFLLYGKFPLIITTCYVNVLPKLIIGPNGKSYTSINYFGYVNGDIKTEDNLQDPTIFNLFGEITSNSEPMIDEDDFLKYLHCLHNIKDQPSKLKKYLENKQLLIIGCNIPDWTFRFMLHSLKEKEGRLYDHGKRKISFRGGAIKSFFEDDLANFLSDIKYIYGNNVCRILSQINAKIKRQQVFISYSAQPGTPIWTWIESFRKKMEASSIVWFFPEQSKRTYGERYWDIIQQGVEKCDVFIPIVTNHMLDVLKNESIGNDGPIDDINQGFICEWSRFLKARHKDSNVRCIPYMMEGNIEDLRELIKSDNSLKFLRPLFFGAQHISGDPANFNPEKMDEFGGTLLDLYDN